MASTLTEHLRALHALHPGEAGLESAVETARLAVDLAPEGLVSFGLGGPEIGVPRPQFKPYFDRARARVLPARADLPSAYAATLGQRNAALRRVAIDSVSSA